MANKMSTSPAEMGATINFAKRDRIQGQSTFAPAQSSLTLPLRADQHVRLCVDKCAKLVMRSACLDTDLFGREAQVKLMVRFVDGRGHNANTKKWSCMLNYLGTDKGGHNIAAITQLGFEVMGGCVFDLCIHSTIKDCCVDIFCNVLPMSSYPDEHHQAKYNDCTPIPMRDVQADMQVVRTRRQFTGLLKHMIFAAFLMLTFMNQIAGGLTKSLPSLHPTSKLAEMQGNETSHNDSPRISPSAYNPPQLNTKQSAPSPSISSSSQTPSSTNTDDFESIEEEATNLFDGGQVTLSPTEKQNDCVDLAIAFLPSWIDESYPIKWEITSADGASWSKEHSNVELFNTIIVDSADDDDQCLLPGSYVLNITAAGEAHYLVYADGKIVDCGGLLKDTDTIVVSLPVDPVNADPECSALVSCEENDTACLKQAFTPLECYNNGTEVDITAADYHSKGNRTLWFGDTCSAILSQVCKSTALGFGVKNDSVTGHDSFCLYFECANSAFSQYVAGGTLDEYYGCECKYAQWSCDKSGAKCDSKSCCLENDVLMAENDLSVGCTCRVEPDCDDGNAEMCGVALDYCCETKLDDVEKRECENKYSRIECQQSVEQKEVDENGHYSYCKQNAESYCEGNADLSGCKCKYWEELCTQYPEVAVCEAAIDYCCPGDFLYMTFCYCDFYEWTTTVGYKSEKQAGWCSTSNTYMQQISNVANDLFGLGLIYKFLGGQFWYDNTNWMSNEDHCEWFGVQCSEGRVSHIKLSSNNVTGDLSIFRQDLEPGKDTGSLFKLQEL